MNQAIKLGFGLSVLTLPVVLIGCSAPGTADTAPGAPLAPSAPADTGGTMFDPGVSAAEPGGAAFGPLGSDTAVPEPDCSSNCLDFPAEPLLEAGLTLADAAGFGAPENFTPGLCLVEPQLSAGDRPGALYPANWTRPRFRWTGGPASALYEIRLSNEIETNSLVAYTRETQWLVPTEVWAKIGRNVHTPITATVRALSGGAVTGVSGTFQIAPVNAGGSVVFWSITSAIVTKDSVKLLGFQVGDEGVAESLTLTQVATRGAIHEGGSELRGTVAVSGKPGFLPGDTQCIGCHTSTPDGTAVVFTDDYPWNKVVASIEPTTAGLMPTFMTTGAEALLKQPWLGTQTMSPAHWQTGDRTLIGSRTLRAFAFGGMIAGLGQWQLAWFDLETPATISPDVPLVDVANSKGIAKMTRDAAIAAVEGTAWGAFAGTGETGHAVTPDWSHDGLTIAYVSTDATPDAAPNGHPGYLANRADIRLVDYNNKAGSLARDLPGAAAADSYEYYPDFSPDDAFIAFNRSPHRGTAGNPTSDGPYYHRFGEIEILPRAGGISRRLIANDPPVCTGVTSPGIINSWPKWSPGVRDVDGKKYYFLIFSSARAYEGQFDLPRSPFTPATLDTRSSQLYMATIVVDEDGTVTDYPAIYLWNQNNLIKNQALSVIGTSNLTPAWDEFVIPAVDFTID